ncbi:T-complex protein 11-like protein 1 [Aricia agestis]|uniref:T-complex protein 11-like protein 1 n=1 Tax=Aricia agestis TaxID=91739 RepID=UPI001C20165C|nr:T-complex protein 11-like protein 1 [Aricia agestis]
MSERENPSGSDNQDEDKSERKTSSSQPIPTGSRGPSYFASEPLQFRVRGSTITGASPPKFVSFEDIMKAAHGMQNMALAHEIAVDQDFKLEPFEPPDNSYQKIVKETMHRAYFDILREQLNSDPPEYKQALVLLEDVKQGLFSILLPRHTRIKQMIEEVLDTDFIKQQAENNSLDFQKYAKFVLDLMAKLAAPARDEMIHNITTMTDTVEIFRAILEALEVLKLDLANTLIALLRPHVQKDSVAYEKAKFDEMLTISEDGLQHTREWLWRHVDTSELTLPVSDPNVIRNVTAQTLAKAYLELLEWDDSNQYPETAVLDRGRFTELGAQVYRLVAVGALLLVSPTAAADPIPHRDNLRDRITIIIDNISNDRELEAVLPAVADEVVHLTEQLLARVGQPPLAADTAHLVRTQIAALADPDNRVRQLVRTRVLEFLKMVLVCGGGARAVPAGLSGVTSQLTAAAGALLRCVMHNKAVFTHHYMDLVAERLAKSS